MEIYLSLLVALIGMLAFMMPTRAEVKEVGRLAFACGLLAFLLRVSGAVFSVLKG